MRIEMMAKTSKMWIKCPTEKKKNPKSQPMIRITAIK